MRRRILLAAAAAAATGACLIAIAVALPSPGAVVPSPGADIPLRSRRSATPPPKRGGRHTASRGFLAFVGTPRNPGNLVERAGIAGRSAEGRQIHLRQFGDPALPGRVLVFDCIHGDECAASGQIHPLANGCPDPAADIYIVPNLDPDGLMRDSRLNGRGVDLNRNFPAGWHPIGKRWSDQYAGPHPFSEPESRLAARIVERLRPRVTIWFHQHAGPGPFVRAWGQSAPAARRFARLSGLPFRLMRWMAGTAPNWQNHRFHHTSSFVVELPSDGLNDELRAVLSGAVDRLAERVAKG